MKSRAERLTDSLGEYSSACEQCNPARMNAAREEIITLFKECVSEKPTDLCSDWYDGIEFCRTETLKNIEELRG